MPRINPFGSPYTTDEVGNCDSGQYLPSEKQVVSDKHGIGVITDHKGVVDKSYQYDPGEKKFHSGIDPSSDVVIAVRSKKRFMEWWKLHACGAAYPIRNYKGVVDSGKVIKMTDQGFNVVGAQFNVVDHTSQEFPFRMNNVEQFMINMRELQSLKNCPRTCKTGQYGTAHTPMFYMDTLIDCPSKAMSLTIFTKATMLNLENSFKENIECLSITAPDFASFDGLWNVDVSQLNITVKNQTSFKGIHRSIKSNVKVLCVSIQDDFPGGVLSLAMLDPGIVLLPDVSGNPPVEFTTSMEVVAQCRKDGLNIHEIQERLIDVGLGKYARL